MTKKLRVISGPCAQEVMIRVDGVFFECHPHPYDAASYGPRSLALAELREFNNSIGALRRFVTPDGIRCIERPARHEQFEHPDRSPR
jgi:3-deoxy-D-manno-octulosonic acid (KDO) 8-phosphate synthase